jgi:hypothetical protein
MLHPALLLHFSDAIGFIAYDGFSGILPIDYESPCNCSQFKNCPRSGLPKIFIPQNGNYC